MARQTTWVLALLVTCVAAGDGSRRQCAQQVRPSSQTGAKDTKDSKDRDGKDKPSAAAKPDERERWKWWLYDRAELGINDHQSASINAIFESTLPKLRETRQELDRAEEEMSRIIKEHKADLAVVSGQLDRLESARSQHNKTRTLMLYRMHLLLSAEQRTKLEALRARRDADRTGPPPIRSTHVVRLIRSSSHFLEALVRKTPTFWAAAVAVAITVPASAQEPARDHVKELIAQAMQQAGQTTPTRPAESTRQPTASPVTPLTADDAVRRALERNLDIQVQRLEPQLLDLQVAALWATYRPSLTSSLFTQGATNLPTSQLQAARRQPRSATTRCSGTPACRRISGGVAAHSRRTSTIPGSRRRDTAATRNPAYTSNIQAQYTQPLLRNFKIDQTRSSLMISQLQSQITDLNLRATLTITEAQVRNAYWDLVFGIDNVEAARRNLELSSKLVRTTAPRWRSARWRRSTSSRPRPKKRPGSRRWSPRKPRAAPTSWR